MDKKRVWKAYVLQTLLYIIFGLVVELLNQNFFQDQERSADHVGGGTAAPLQHRRAASAVERAGGGHESGGTATADAG